MKYLVGETKKEEIILITSTEENNWRKRYRAKEISLDNLPQYLQEIIKPGSYICIGSGCSEPVALTNNLVTDKHRWSDSKVLHFFTLSNQKFFSEQFPTRFRHNTISIIGTSKMRDAINRGKADFTPLNASEIPAKLKKMPIDVAFIQTSPPDKNGFLSLGINVDTNRAIVEVAKTVIVQVNPSMPRTHGDSFIKFKDINYFIYKEEPLLEYPPPNVDETSRKIAKYVSKLIENGSTLNLGIGKIPYALPQYLENKKNLAIYSEVLLESIIPLIEKDIVNCSKNYFPHCMTSFIIGTKKFYDFVDDNVFVEFHPTDFLNKIENLAKNHKLCSVYSAMSCDLLGQATNHIGGSIYGGVGGEGDFMYGSSISKGGKCIIALPSITKKGKTRIHPLLPPGPITLRAIDVHYVVTEWGIAYLHGKSIRERVLQMIAIAHPSHRKHLLEEAKKQNYIYADQLIPATQNGIAVIRPDVEWYFKTNTKGKIFFSPIKATDERMLQDLYYSLSERDRVLRFLSPQQFFSHKETQSRIICDYQTSFLIVGIVGKEEGQRIIAVGGYYLAADTDLVEFGVTVHEDYRREGLGTKILDKIIDLSLAKGYSGICGDILNTNIPMIHILDALKYNVVFSHESSETLHFQFYFSDKK